MELMPYFIGFAVICLILSVGLQTRATWTWYAGWVLLYLFAGYVGTFFFSALYYASTPNAAGAAALYLFGGLLFWMPVAVWWAGHRHLFGPRRKRPAPPVVTPVPPPSNP